MPQERALTTQQRTCIEHVASGDSYQVAGEKAGYAPKGAKAHVCRMLTKGNAQEYLDELRESTKSSKIATIQERQEILTAHMRREGVIGAEASIMDSQRAVAELNKMTGAYTPEKVDHTHDVIIEIGGAVD